MRKRDHTDALAALAITFAGSGTVILSGTPLRITGNITINGAAGVTVSGGNASRIIDAVAGATLTLRNLTLTNAAGELVASNKLAGRAVAPGGVRVSRQPFARRLRRHRDRGERRAPASR